MLLSVELGMQIWAHTMFKNDERWLWFAVTSIIDQVDKLLLWDTGSTDKSWQVANYLKKTYGSKIDLKQYGEVTVESFPKARQAMLDATGADWFIVADDDEIWWEDSVTKLVEEIKNAEKNIESFVVPTFNCVGDIYHYQPQDAGKYKFGNVVGHYNLRAVKRNIPGLHSQGMHGVWGWADEEGKQIQNRSTFKIIDTPYLHTTFLSRSQDRKANMNVPKRARKYKYEIGQTFPLDYYYPESLFKDRPGIVPSPWECVGTSYKIRSYIETPLRKLNRKIFNKVGY